MNAFLPALILLALVFVPLLLVAATLVWLRRREAREARRSPLKEKLAHLPGEQARRKVDELNDLLMERMTQLLMVGPMAMLVLLLPRVRWSALKFGAVEWGVIAFAVLATVWLARDFFKVRRQRVAWGQGARAEVAVAQQLDRLQEQGCLLLHDLPANGFNIDHVVIGASAVFAVETKSRRKVGNGKASANVAYDGSVLQFPNWTETRPLEQAEAQARWLSDYLRGETGEPVVVIPVLCLPGWFVQAGRYAHRAAVRVINPKMTGLFMDMAGRPALSQAQRNRIVHALYKRYPELED